ncbi:MAG: hypothetical protein SGI86_09340 [Deltaproteobacteria bacterium]|nr:hypothetical protein [Deltaproteobacteria bacterium]
MVLVALLATNVELRSDLECPSEAAVNAELLRFGLATSVGKQGDRVDLTRGEHGEVLLALTGEDGAKLGDRTFEPPFECHELASAIALTVAIWESDLHPEYTPILGSREGTDVDTTAPVETSPPRNVVEEPRISSVRDERRTRDASILDSEVGIGASFFQAPTQPAFASSEFAVGIGVIGIHRPPAWPIGIWLSGNLEQNRTTEVALGKGEWQRTRGTLAMTRSFPLARSHLFLDGRAGLSAARLSASGVGFAINFDASSFDLGVELGVRLSLRRSAFVPWLDLGVVRWLSSSVLRQTDPESGQSLPNWLFGMTLGVSLGWAAGG